MKPTDADYVRGVSACITTCARWRAEHPDARLKFNPIPVCIPTGQRGPGGLIASLDLALARGVAGNSVTRKLLVAIDRGCPRGGATVIMVELALLYVYGIRSALTKWEMSNADKAKMD